MIDVANDLLQRMTGGVPAKQGAPVEHNADDEVVETRGRTVDDVMSSRGQSDRDDTRTVETPAIRKYKVNGREMTAQELEESGLLDNIVTTASQFPSLQKKYTETLEEKAKAPAATAQPANQPRPVVTQAQIRAAMAVVMRAAVEGGYLEADFVEAYPDVAANMCYGSGRIQNLEDRVTELVNWVNREAYRREVEEVQGGLATAMDAVAARPEPIYAPLKDREIRDKFAEWLAKEVDPKLEKLTEANMAKFWIAYNSEGYAEWVKKQAAAPERKEKRRAAGDGTTSRQGGGTDAPRPLLDRLVDSKMGATQ